MLITSGQAMQSFNMAFSLKQVHLELQNKRRLYRKELRVMRSFIICRPLHASGCYDYEV
jgi:hypothetical protein